MAAQIIEDTKVLTFCPHSYEKGNANTAKMRT